MTHEERNKKVAEAREKYGKPFVHEREFSKPKCKKSALPKSQFQFQRKPLP